MSLSGASFCGTCFMQTRIFTERLQASCLDRRKATSINDRKGRVRLRIARVIKSVFKAESLFLEQNTSCRCKTEASMVGWYGQSPARQTRIASLAGPFLVVWRLPLLFFLLLSPQEVF